MYIVSTSQMKTIEQNAIKSGRLSGFDLMKNAAFMVFKELLIKCDNNIYKKHIIIFCGSGNNGGDGYYLGKLLLEHNANVQIISICDTDVVNGDAKLALLEYLNLGGEIKDLNFIKNNYNKNCICIVDAVFGTGLKRDVQGTYKEAIDFINSLDVFKISVDIPSGINADSGQVMGDAVKADMTLSFVFKKLCHVTYPCIDYMGELKILPIGIKKEDICFENLNYYEIDENLIDKIIPVRKENTHKGSYGRLLVVAGSRGMAGAACLASRAAMRSGVGLCTLAIPESIYGIVATKLDEVMTMPLFETEEGGISKDCEKFIFDNAKRFNAVLMGCGMQNFFDTQELVKDSILTLDKPLIIDADGLNALALNTDVLNMSNTDIILTPHPLEMSRLCRLQVSDIENNRVVVAENFAKRYLVTLVLKGARTIVALPDGRVFVNSTGNCGMATGGSGDVLAGIISSFTAQGIKPEDAAIAGVYIHGKAGDASKDKFGKYAMIASDIIDSLGGVLKKYD